jgi:hypothetical protein
MPRTKGKNEKAKSTELVVVEIEGDAEVLGFFPLVVRSFNGKLPGSAGYDAEKDQLLVGFRFGNSTTPSWLPYNTKTEEVSSYDFLTDPKTGMRAGQKIPPHGSAYTSLEHGISAWTDLPPLFIWRQGMWVSEILWKKDFDVEDLPSFVKTKALEAMGDWPVSGVPPLLYQYYITSGEGSTGNNLYRVFEIPKELCHQKPHHPIMWKEEYRKSKISDWRTKPTPTTVTKPASTVTAPKLPAGLRYRCPTCGHWFDQSDLPGHATVCGKGEDADWAIMCHRDCGCENLDQAAKAKPGFPRPKKEAEKDDGDGAGAVSEPATPLPATD